MSKYNKQVITIAKQYGFVNKIGDISYGIVERYAMQGKAEMEMGLHCGAKREVAILLMALGSEKERICRGKDR